MKTPSGAKNKTSHLATIKIQRAGGHKHLSSDVQAFLDLAATGKNKLQN